MGLAINSVADFLIGVPVAAGGLQHDLRSRALDQRRSIVNRQFLSFRPCAPG